MNTDLFGNPLPDRTPPARRRDGRKTTQPNGYARRPGSGPAGETCGTCENCVRVRGGTRAYPKCLVIRHRWTGGPGTDIKVKSPACELWKRKGI